MKAMAELQTEPYRLRRQVGEIDTTELCGFESGDETVRGTSFTVYHHSQLTYLMVYRPDQKSDLGIPSEIPSICESARRYASSCQILPDMYLVDYIHTMINETLFYCYKSIT